MDRLLCAHCGELIGVYEPIVLLLPDGTEPIGSTLTLGDQLRTLGVTPVHAACREALESGPSGRAAR